MIPGTNPQSKFQIIGSYTALPGQCSSCGKSDGPAVDTGLSFDFYGAVTFCQLCAQDIGRQAGLADPVAEKDPFLPDYMSEIKYQVGRYDSTILAAITELRDYLANLPDVAPIEASPNLGGTSEPEIGTGESGGTESPTADPAGQISDTTVDEGSASVSSSTGHGKPRLKFEL